MTELIEDNSVRFRSSIENDNGFSIVFDETMYVYTDSVATTYTIGIVKDHPNVFEFSNLIVEFPVNDTPKAFILDYVPSQDYLNAYALNDQTPFQGIVNYKPLDYDGSLDSLNVRRICKSISLTYCNYGGETHAAGVNCTAANMFSITYDICYENGDDVPLNESIDLPTGPNTGGGGSPNSNPTNPLPINTCQGENGEEGLTGNDGNCYNADVVTIAQQLNAILSEDDSFEFVENGSTDGFMDFDAVEEFEEFLDGIDNSTEGLSFNSSLQNGQILRTETMQINSFPDIYFNVQILLNSPEMGTTDNYSIQEVQSGVTGTVSFVDWEETLSEPLIQDLGDQLKITITGDMSFGITIYDVPLMVKKRCTCIIKINKLTGVTELKWFYINSNQN